MEWSVAVEVAGPMEIGGGVVLIEIEDEKLEELVDYLKPYHPAVFGTAEEPSDGLSRYGVRLAIGAHSPEAAVTEAVTLFSKAIPEVGLPDWPVVRVEATEWEEFERQLDEPTHPDLLGVTELAQLLGVSRQRASELAHSTHFPRPIAELASGPVWFETNVQRFVRNWKRHPGRPRKVTASS